MIAEMASGQAKDHRPDRIATVLRGADLAGEPLAFIPVGGEAEGFPESIGDGLPFQSQATVASSRPALDRRPAFV
jgi:hypothetical protein